MMAQAQPIAYNWREVDIVDADGVATRMSAMVPIPRYRNVAKRQFVANAEYVLDEAHERSMASRRIFLRR